MAEQDSSMPQKERTKFTFIDSISIVALLLGVYLVIVVPPLPLKVILLVAVCVGMFMFSHRSHWSHGWSRWVRHLVGWAVVVFLCAIAIPQFISQWVQEHPRATTSQPPQSHEEPSDKKPPTVEPIPKAHKPKDSVVKANPVNPPSVKTGDIKAGDCSNVQIGSSGNQTVNCGPVERERHLSLEQINELKEAISSAPEGQQVNLAKLPLKASSNFAWEIYTALMKVLDPSRIKINKGQPIGPLPLISWGGPTPIGIIVLIHDKDAETKPTALKLRGILSEVDDSPFGFYPEAVEPKEIRIVIGEVSRNAVSPKS